MKKTILTVFGIIIVLVIALIAVNIATNGSVWNTVLKAVASPINNAWHSITGDTSSDLIDVDSILDSSGINQEGSNNIGDLIS
jgi:hypothetical protein